MRALATRPGYEKVTKVMACRSNLHGPTNASRYLIMRALGSSLVACASADSRQQLVQISTPELPQPVVQQRTATPAADQRNDPGRDDQDEDTGDDAKKLLMAAPESLANEPEIAAASAIEAHEPSSATQSGGNGAGPSNRIATDIDGTARDPIVPINYAGSWTAINSTGRSCRTTLSMAKAGDARRASTSGCAGDGMSQVSAWDLRGDTIVLFGSGSVPVARFAAAPRAMSGTLANSGDPVTLSR